MGSKKAWGAAIGTVLAPGLGTAAGYAVGKKQDDKAKAKKKSGGEATSVEDGAADVGAEGGKDPFTDTLAEKKKRVNTLFTGSNVGALSGAGGSQGALTLGS